MHQAVPRVDLTKTEPVFGWDYKGKSIDLRCPNGHIGSLRDHEILESGIVRPSLECAKCSFHAHIKLMSYSDEPTKVVTGMGLQFHVPLWTGYLAQDSDGRWCAYLNRPEAHHTVWLPRRDETKCKTVATKKVGDWRSSLIKVTHA